MTRAEPDLDRIGSGIDADELAEASVAHPKFAPNSRFAPDTRFAGRWSTDCGELRLVRLADFVVGDYANLGILAGAWNGEAFVGRFTNDDRTGWFRFPFDPDSGQFGDGRWGWLDEQTSGEWQLSRQSDRWPELEHLTRDVTCR